MLAIVVDRQVQHYGAVLAMPPWSKLRPRIPRLLFGLVLFGIGLALMVVAELGLAPWVVLHQGISRRTGIPIGTVGIMVGFTVLLLWIPLRERFGIGTVANIVIVGIVLDLALLALPSQLDHDALRWSAVFGGVLLVGLGSGFYVGVGLGPGPRDGLMTGISQLRGYPIWSVRATIELSVLVVGWLLGGTVGAGTVVFALAIGPSVQRFLNRLRLPPL